MPKLQQLQLASAGTEWTTYGDFTPSELGFVEITVAALLGHRSGTVTSRYIHHIDSVLVAAADHVADLIEDAMAGKAQTAEIKDFPKPLVRDGRRP